MQFTSLFLLALSAIPSLSAPTAEAAPEAISAPETNHLVARANDYPYKGSCGGVDPWNFYKCQCTSFVAWRINDRKGIKFTNQYKGQHWGNANSWNDAAKASGVKVSATPKVGTIAQTDAGSAGHVAWVSAVSGSKVTVEEFNYVNSEAYGTRTVAASTFRYIYV